MKIFCTWCGKEYDREKKKINEAIKNNWLQFCSNECQSLYRKNLFLYKRIHPDVLFKPTPYELKNTKYYCERCKKQHDGFYGSGRFCCQKCSKQFVAAVNKKEANKKTSETLKRKHFDQTKEKLKHVSKDVKFTITGNEINIQKICKCCGEIFEVRYRKRYQKCCSQKCASKLNWQNPEYRNNLVNQINEKVKNGTHSGWKSREGLKPSFAEQFFIKVLNNNKIYFKREYKYDKYFLDFFIEVGDRKIDFEVDGKQHKYPARITSDKKRDKFLAEKGLEVYRIKWKHPKKHSNYIKKEIDKLLEFIK